WAPAHGGPPTRAPERPDPSSPSSPAAPPMQTPQAAQTPQPAPISTTAGCPSSTTLWAGSVARSSEDPLDLGQGLCHRRPVRVGGVKPAGEERGDDRAQ